MDKKRNHIIFWVGYFMYYYFMYYYLVKDLIDEGTFTIKGIFVSVFKISFGTVVSFYILNLNIFPSTLPLKKYFKLCFFVAILVFLIFEINYQVGQLFHYLSPQDIPSPNIGKSINLTILSIQHSFAFALIFWFSKIFIANAKYQRFLQDKQNVLRNNILSAELLALKNQINPHFFYNMLNFFYAQFLPYSKSTSTAILKLSDMMRYTIRDNHYEGKALLENEINYLKNYIDLENVNRYSDVIVVSINGNPTFKKVRPLIFLPILEHCCLFGMQIKLKMDIDDNYVMFSGYYIKKNNVTIPHILESVESIKQKISYFKECNIMFSHTEMENNFQMSIVP
ncbi:histidine kinase [Arcicella aurantiaca]|uniref:Histidine kinase n=1 Tax=Arcicella aurantiaca TaxID=591202 RepID=A0A316EDJ2_9BACT|nr:sensor histidine kinase [Arcicella aurantiaca]PWK27440.1 histidine kinase [Arcicella aurantiaca]